MLFVTNRVLREGPTPQRPDGSFEIPRSIHFALENNQAEQSIYFCKREAKDTYVEIGNQAFFNALKTANVQQLLFYVHGYSNLPEPAVFPQAEHLQALCDEKEPGYVLVIPLIWPCDNDLGMVKDYYDDQIAADASSYAFARLFQKFLAWREDNSTVDNPCLKQINLLAHSMGNRVLRGTFARTVEYYQHQGVPLIFRNTFMAAADIENDCLNLDRNGRLISDASRNVLVYFAADDLAMRASKVANMSIATRRLGHTGPAQIDKVATNVYSLDCSDFNNDYDRPTGHSYFGRDQNGQAGIVFNHIWYCIRTGRPPNSSGQSRRQILRGQPRG